MSRLQGVLKKVSKIRLIFLILITISVFYFIFSKIELGSVITVFRQADSTLLIYGLMVTLLFPIVMAKRWQVVLNQMNCNLSFKSALVITMSVFPFNAFLPSKSGDLVKALLIRKKLNASKTIGSVLAERSMDMLVLTVLSVCGLYLSKQYSLLMVPLLIILAISSLVILSRFNIKLRFADRWNRRINDLLLSLRIISKKKIVLIQVVLLTICSWILTFIQVILFFRAFSIDIPLPVIFGNIPLSIFVGIIPVTFAGMGTRDSAMIVLFSSYAPPAIMLSIGLLYSLTGYFILAVLGIPFALYTFKQGKSL